VRAKTSPFATLSTCPKREHVHRFKSVYRYLKPQLFSEELRINLEEFWNGCDRLLNQYNPDPERPNIRITPLPPTRGSRLKDQRGQVGAEIGNLGSEIGLAVILCGVLPQV